MGKRRRSREIALQVLYQMEVSPCDPHEALELFCQEFCVPEDVREFTAAIVEGVHRHQMDIDLVIEQYSEHWKLHRMDRVDRNLLRMGVFELLYRDDIPPKVTLNEAIDLGKKFGSEESGAFINGILDRIKKTREKG